MAKKKSSGWLDKYDEGGPIDPRSSTVAKTDATAIKQQPKLRLKTKAEIARDAEIEKTRLAEEAAKRQTYISADNVSPEQKARARKIREQQDYINNSQLAQSLQAISTTPGLGAIAAQTITEMNPAMSIARQVQTFKDPDNNPYGLGPNSGTFENILGTIGYLGDAFDFASMINPAIRMGASAARPALMKQAYKVGQANPQLVNLINNTIPNVKYNAINYANDLLRQVVGKTLNAPKIPNVVKEAVLNTKPGKTYQLAREGMYPTIKHALGNELNVASYKELKEAFEESSDRFKRGMTSNEFQTTSQLDKNLQDYSKAMALDLRLKFADRLRKFNDPGFAGGEPGYQTRDSLDFLNKEGYDINALTPQERVLMSAYTHGYDSNFNRRDHSFYNISQDLQDYYNQLSNQFNKSVQKNQFNNPNILDRGTYDYTVELVDASGQPIDRKLRSELQVGDIFKDEGFLSTSLPHNNLWGNQLERIIVPEGGVQSYAFPNSMRSSVFPNENEIILPKGLIRRVEEVYPNKRNRETFTTILNPYEKGGKVNKRGGWLDKYEDGGELNYNNYNVSFSPDFVGQGYDTTGRNYSPAWGGQFKYGGEITTAQGGTYVPATRSDSVNVYNNAKAIQDYYKKQGYQKTDPSIESKLWKDLANDNLKYIEKIKKSKHISKKEKERKIKLREEDIKEYTKRAERNNPKNYLGALADAKKDFEESSYNDEMLKHGAGYTDKEGVFHPSKPALEEYYKPIDENTFNQREQSYGFLDLRSPMPLYDKRIAPQGYSHYYNPNRADNVQMYEYDPLATMPWDMVPIEQQQERIQKYGPAGAPADILKKNPSWITPTKPAASTPVTTPSTSQSVIDWMEGNGYAQDFVPEVPAQQQTTTGLPFGYIEDPRSRQMHKYNTKTGELEYPFQGGQTHVTPKMKKGGKVCDSCQKAEDGEKLSVDERRKRVLAKANEIFSNKDLPYQLPDYVVNSKEGQGKADNVCIHGVCGIMTDVGFVPHGYYTNTSFAEHAQDYGFSRSLGDIRLLKPGDIFQWKQATNDYGKPYPTHAQIFKGINPNTGMYEFYDYYNKYHGGEGINSYFKEEIENALRNIDNKDVHDAAQFFSLDPNAVGGIPENPFPYNLSEKEQQQHFADTHAHNTKYSVEQPQYPLLDTDGYDRAQTKNKLVSYFNDKKLDEEIRKKLKITDQELQKVKPLIYGIMDQETDFGNPNAPIRNLKYDIKELLGLGSHSIGPAAVKYEALSPETKKAFNIKSPRDLSDLKNSYIGALDVLTKGADYTDAYINRGEHIGISDKHPLARALYWYNNPSNIIRSDSQTQDLIRDQAKDLWFNMYNPNKKSFGPFGTFETPGDIELRAFNSPLTMDRGSYPDKVIQQSKKLRKTIDFNDPSILENVEVKSIPYSMQSEPVIEGYRPSINYGGFMSPEPVDYIPTPYEEPYFAMGGSIPGSVGFTYARTGSTPNNGKYAKKTLPSAQDGKEIPKLTTTKFLPPEIKHDEEVYKPEPRPEEIQSPIQIASDSYDRAKLAAQDEAAKRDIEEQVKREVIRNYFTELAGIQRYNEREDEKYKSLSGVRGDDIKDLEKDLLKGRQKYPDLYDYSLNKYHHKYNKARTNEISLSDVLSLRQKMAEYVNSPLYAKRQGYNPETYTGQSLDVLGIDENEFQNTIAREKRDARLKQLNDTTVEIANEQADKYVPFENKIKLNKLNDMFVAGHEIGHSTTFDPYIKNDEGDILKDANNKPIIRTNWDKGSDIYNSAYFYSENDKDATPISKLFLHNPSFSLNENEINKFIKYAAPTKGQQEDEHYDKSFKRPQSFANEQYGDLQAFREMLHKYGITKSYGEDIDRDKLDKALQNKNITTHPNFKRFYERYGDNIINLNNTIAANNLQQGTPVAQNGMKFYQNGLDFKPKSISKKGKKIIKDDRGQWAHPGEITKIGSNNITMKGVPYPVLGISDLGDTQMMYPDQDYTYSGNSVTEYPMAQGGKNVAYADATRVGDVARFTNPNTPRPPQPDTLGENIFEIIDPSGISSWDDILRSAIDTGMSGQTALEMFGAIPFLGKFKKAGQFLDIISKTVPKTGRQAKNVKASVAALKGIGKYGPNAGRATDAYQAYDQYAQGGQLTKLDQLTNFTNYNTKQPGGWLDKYK